MKRFIPTCAIPLVLAIGLLTPAPLAAQGNQPDTGSAPRSGAMPSQSQGFAPAQQLGSDQIRESTPNFNVEDMLKSNVESKGPENKGIADPIMKPDIDIDKIQKKVETPPVQDKAPEPPKDQGQDPGKKPDQVDDKTPKPDDQGKAPDMDNGQKPDQAKDKGPKPDKDDWDKKDDWGKKGGVSKKGDWDKKGNWGKKGKRPHGVITYIWYEGQYRPVCGYKKVYECTERKAWKNGKRIIVKTCETKNRPVFCF